MANRTSIDWRLGHSAQKPQPLDDERDVELPFPNGNGRAQFIVNPRRGAELVQLLLVCRSREELLVVGFHLYHRLEINEAAARAGVSPGRARDLMESIRARLVSAERQRRVMDVMDGGKHG